MHGSDGNKVLPDFTEIIKLAASKPERADYCLPYIAIDECLNCPDIERLCISLLQRNFTRGSGPLWYQLRIRSDGTKISVPGGVDKNSILRINPLIGDIGKPAEYYSFDDLKVVQGLVASLLGNDRIVLLSENTKNDQYGLRRLLTVLVRDQLSNNHGNRLSLVALFKKGRTPISDYCEAVVKFIQDGYCKYGYSERRL